MDHRSAFALRAFASARRAAPRAASGGAFRCARALPWCLVACLLIRLLYGHRFTDLGPFRAVRWEALERLGMADPNFGWTAEMQVKAKHTKPAGLPAGYQKAA